MAKKKNHFENLDDFTKFFQHCNYYAYQSGTDPESYMLMNNGSTAPIVIMVTPQQVTIHRGDDQHFYSCSREEWGPDFLEQCGRKEGKYRNDYETIARNYRSYSTLDVLGKYLVDYCGLRVQSEKYLKPQICHLEQTVCDALAYYTLSIDFREDRTYFDLNFETFPYTDKKANAIKYGNMTDWSLETLERIGKELPIKVLSDYIRKYKKTLKSSENV